VKHYCAGHYLPEVIMNKLIPGKENRNGKQVNKLSGKEE
jgi:hypothetical protein